MIKKLSSKWLLCFCGVMLTASMLSGQVTDNDNHVPVGARALPVEEHMEQQKTRAIIENQASPEAALGAHAEANESDAEQVAHHDIYYTSHPGAYHTLYNLGIGGNSVELEDGSIWSVSSGDTYKVLNWLPNDVIVITPNRSWFSCYTYPFRLTNQATGVSVETKMTLGPIYNAPFTHWIVGIDYYNNMVYLEDGTIWNMSFFDGDILRKWVVNDTVIIGINDGWITSKPNILINVNMLNYARGIVAY